MMVARGSPSILVGVMNKVKYRYTVKILGGQKNIMCEEIMESSQLISKAPDLKSVIDHIALRFCYSIPKKILCNPKICGPLSYYERATMALLFT